MKKLFLLTGLLMVSLVISAQHVVSGTVTDKDGNPIPGAKVEIVGSTETYITELDGTYSIETTAPAKKVKVQYAGMQTTIKKIKPDMVVKLSTTNWWNAKPDKYRWLLSIQGAFPENGVSNPSLGLMVGCVKNIGWYVKGVYCPRESVEDDGNMDDWMYNWRTGKEDRSFLAATGGMIVRLGCPFHLYGGLGYAERQIAWETADGKWHKVNSYFGEDHYSYTGLAIDAGLLLNLGRFTLNAGIMMISGEYDEYIVGNFGIGYCF